MFKFRPFPFYLYKCTCPPQSFTSSLYSHPSGCSATLLIAKNLWTWSDSKIDSNWPKSFPSWSLKLTSIVLPFHLHVECEYFWLNQNYILDREYTSTSDWNISISSPINWSTIYQNKKVKEDDWRRITLCTYWLSVVLSIGRRRYFGLISENNHNDCAMTSDIST